MITTEYEMSPNMGTVSKFWCKTFHDINLTPLTIIVPFDYLNDQLRGTSMTNFKLELKAPENVITDFIRLNVFERKRTDILRLNNVNNLILINTSKLSRLER